MYRRRGGPSGLDPCPCPGEQKGRIISTDGAEAGAGAGGRGNEDELKEESNAAAEVVGGCDAVES